MEIKINEYIPNETIFVHKVTDLTCTILTKQNETQYEENKQYTYKCSNLLRTKCFTLPIAWSSSASLSK